MNLFNQKVIQFIQCNLLTILASAGTSTNTRRTSTRTVRVLVNSCGTAAMVIVTGTVTGFLLIIFARGTDKRPKSKCTVPCPLLVLHHIYTEKFKRTGKSGNTTNWSPCHLLLVATSSSVSTSQCFPGIRFPSENNANKIMTPFIIVQNTYRRT